MRAVVYDRYGPPDVLRLEQVERPVPKDNEVLVRIHATTVNRTDTGFRSAEFFVARFFTGLLRPRRKILGSEFAGEVEAVGTAVTEFAAGDRARLIRHDRKTGKQTEYDLKIASLLKRGDVSANVRLEPGDVIIIPESMF